MSATEQEQAVNRDAATAQSMAEHRMYVLFYPVSVQYSDTAFAVHPVRVCSDDFLIIVHSTALDLTDGAAAAAWHFAVAMMLMQMLLLLLLLVAVSTLHCCKCDGHSGWLAQVEHQTEAKP
jgi:thiosulfate reductase cytochrome b subunit